MTDRTQGTIKTTKVTTTSTTPITTLVPGITQPAGLAPLDLLARFPMQHLLLERFSPNAIFVDRYFSPLWLPFTLIGCTVCTVVYAFFSCKCSDLPRKSQPGFLRINGNNMTHSIYLTSLSVVKLIRALLVILIDLDTAWDTGLLACNQLFCPLTHALSTASKLAIALLTLTLGIESLSMIYPKSSLLLCPPVRCLLAGGRYKKSIHITVAVILTSLVFGMVETVYWRVQYYLPSATSQGSNIHQGYAPPPLARCEVTGSFHHMFTTRIDKKTVDGFLDEATQQFGASTRLAASYADYKWISGITVDSILSLSSICVSLVVMRARLMASPDRAETTNMRNRLNPGYLSLDKQDLGPVIALNLIQGLCRLPEELFTMLEPLTRPGEVNLTDAEIELDGTWQRYFMMLTARVICRELADLPGAFLLPVCLGFSPQFRQHCFHIFGCWFLAPRQPTRSKPKQVRRHSDCTYSENMLHNSYPGSYLTGMSEVNCSRSPRSPGPLIAQYSRYGERRNYPDIGQARGVINDQSKPLWKWGEGWVMPHPTVDRNYPNEGFRQYAPLRRTLTSSEPLYYQSDKRMMQNQPRFNQINRGMELFSSQNPYRPTYQQRAASTNDLLYDPQRNVESFSRTLPRTQSKVDWFEPRSYV